MLSERKNEDLPVECGKVGCSNRSPAAGTASSLSAPFFFVGEGPLPSSVSSPCFPASVFVRLAPAYAVVPEASAARKAKARMPEAS
jgi:hypothetical protein